MKKNDYIAPRVEQMELGMEMLLEASPVIVDTGTDAIDPALGRPLFDEMPFNMNN